MFDINNLSLAIETIFKKYKSLLVYIKGSPDPDVIASSYALQIIGAIYDTKIDILSRKKISLENNKLLIDLLDIRINFSEQQIDFSKYEGYIILDYQSIYVEEIGDMLKCVLHIDHHKKIDENKQIEYEFIFTDIGSVSTVFTILIDKYKNIIDKLLLKKIYTALFYGIMTDTDNFSNIHYYDKIAKRILINYYDKVVIEKIIKLPMSENKRKIFEIGLNNLIKINDWILSGVGYIPEIERDTISILADKILKDENCLLVVVFALIYRDKGLHLDASFRTNNSSIDLNSIIKKITHNGGGRKNKGAFQINFDFFYDIIDKEKFWDLIQNLLIQKLKKINDEYNKNSIKNFFSLIKNIFKK